MMTTRLPVARIWFRDRVVAFAAAVLLRQELHGEMNAFELAAGNLQDRAAARRRRRAGWRRTPLRRSSTGTLPPTWALVQELHPFVAHLFHAAVDDVLLHLEIGNAVAQQAADAVGLFEDRDVVAGARSCCAAASPAGPEPTTATRLPVRNVGRLGTESSLPRKPRSTMVFSICLMVTGGSLMPSTQDASQGAGQMRPVNSGKLLVA